MDASVPASPRRASTTMQQTRRFLGSLRSHQKSEAAVHTTESTRWSFGDAVAGDRSFRSLSFLFKEFKGSSPLEG
jgi:hypothetical protein